MLSNNNDNPFEGVFGNPFSFGCADLQAQRIITEGIMALNQAAAAPADKEQGLDAAAALFKVSDPVVRLALLRRFVTEWNEMVEAIVKVVVDFHVFGDKQDDAFKALIEPLRERHEAIKQQIVQEAEARVAAGFDQPWVREETTTAPEVDLSDEDRRISSLLLQQLFESENSHKGMHD